MRTNEKKDARNLAALREYIRRSTIHIPEPMGWHRLWIQCMDELGRLKGQLDVLHQKAVVNHRFYHMRQWPESIVAAHWGMRVSIMRQRIKRQLALVAEARKRSFKFP